MQFQVGDVVEIQRPEQLKVISIDKNGTVWCRPSWWWALFGGAIGFNPKTEKIKLIRRNNDQR